MRYPMNIAQDPIANFVLSIFNVNSNTAYVELTADSLIVKEGHLFEESFDLSNLGRAELIPWEWYMGVGVRTDFQNLVAAVTSTEKVVAIPLKQSRQLFIPLAEPLGLRVPCTKIAFSLRDADTFLNNFNVGRVNPDQGPTPVPIE